MSTNIETYSEEENTEKEEKAMPYHDYKSNKLLAVSGKNQIINPTLKENSTLIKEINKKLKIKTSKIIELIKNISGDGYLLYI